MNYRLADCAFYATLFWIYFLANRTVLYKVGEIRNVWNKTGAVWFQELKKLGISQIIEQVHIFLTALAKPSHYCHLGRVSYILLVRGLHISDESTYHSQSKGHLFDHNKHVYYTESNSSLNKIGRWMMYWPFYIPRVLVCLVWNI